MSEDRIREAINHALSMGSPDPAYTPDYSEPRPEPHASHEWAKVSDRWLECSKCGTRNHWPAAETRCSRPTGGRTKIDDTQAWNQIIADLERFFDWWSKRRDTPATLPYDDEGKSSHRMLDELFGDGRDHL